MADQARRAALTVLTRVRTADAYANLLLPTVLRERELEGRDAAFVTELVSGTLRRRATYDAILASVATKPLSKLHPKALDALRLGVHQILAMRTPSHAAVNASVSMIRREVGTGPAGMANAVLRKVAERDLDQWLDVVAPGRAAEALAVRESHPAWIVAELAAALGAVGADAELEALLRSHNEQPKVMLCARPGLATIEELAPAVPTGRTPYAAELPGGQPWEIAAVAQGRAGVQDEGSQLVAVTLAQAALQGSDEQWLDLCAGPGGKAALLGALAAQRGAHLIANEPHEHRAALVRQAVDPLAATVSVVVGDARSYQGLPADRVLLDVPCSGLGALRRRPEARWRRQSDDLAALTALQDELVAAGAAALRPGGVLLYATCSPVLAETREVVLRALARDPELELVPIEEPLPESAGPLPGTVQLWPHRHHTDAMFAALLRRRDPGNAAASAHNATSRNTA